MKKLIALLAVMTLCAALFVPAMAEENADLVAAKDYIRLMYKNKPETTPVDYTVVGQVNIGGVMYAIDWTADSETVKFVRGEDNMVTVDVDEENPEEVHYVLTATLKDENGNTVSTSFNHKVPASINLEGKTEGEIAEFLHSFLADNGQAMPMSIALRGTVSEIPTPYSEEYKNITVNLVCDGKAESFVQCYRLSGEGADKIAVGDEIGVMGIVKNYKGTIEFDKGCVIVPADCVADLRTALDAYTLEEGAAQKAPKTMTGVIVSIDTAWSADYQNITVSIAPGNVADYKVQCYRLSGEGADTLAVGDTITVTGTIKNYKGTIEFDKGCTLDAVVKAE